MLIISGNLSFLNWLTILPALACFDDRSLAWLFNSSRLGVKSQVSLLQSEEGLKTQNSVKWGL